MDKIKFHYFSKLSVVFIGISQFHFQTTYLISFEINETSITIYTISHFRVPVCLCFKASFSFHKYNTLYYIFKLVRALWVVNLTDRTLPHAPLKFKVVCVAKLLRDLSPKFLNLYSKERSKTFFYSKLCAKALTNDFKLIRFAFDLLQKFEGVPHEWKSFSNPSDTQ